MSETQKQKINELAKELKLEFKDVSLFENAFVHRSYLNENPGFKLSNNERLEFLGDAVLELAVTEYLYENFPNPEGDLTAFRSALVKGQSLSRIAKELEILDCLYLSYGERTGSTKSHGLILANCFEAIIGAIYLDQGFKKAKEFVRDYVVKPNLDQIIEGKLYIDSKSEFQEKVQEKFKVTPIYKVTEETGPDHNKEFVSGVYIGEDMITTGSGASKNASEQEAARNALEKLFRDQGKD